MAAEPQTEATPNQLVHGAGVHVRSQIMFRRLNEQIRALTDEFALENGFDLVCECADRSCFERLIASVEDYEAIRRFPTRFVVSPGHAAPPVERVVQETAAFQVVEKVSWVDAETAILLDPRRDTSQREGVA